MAEAYAVDLIAFRSEGDREEPLAALKQLCNRLEIIDVSRKGRIQGILGRPDLPLSVAARCSGLCRRTIREWSSGSRYERVHAEWSQMAEYQDDVKGVPDRSLYVHDVLAQWAERRTVGRFGWFWTWEAKRTRKWESRAYQGWNRLFVPSFKDKELLGKESPGLPERTSVLPLHFDVFRTVTERRFEGPLRLLFWGALGRHENAQAARWLSDKLRPELRRAGVEFVLVLAGSNPPRDILARQASDLTVTGFLADPAYEFDRAHLALAPLFVGAGVKVKVLECLAAGLPVLTTAVGSEGINAGPKDGLVTLPACVEEFARYVIKWNVNRNELAQLSIAASNWGKLNNRDYRSLFLNTKPGSIDTTHVQQSQ